MEKVDTVQQRGKIRLGTAVWKEETCRSRVEKVELAVYFWPAAPLFHLIHAAALCLLFHATPKFLLFQLCSTLSTFSMLLHHDYSFHAAAL